MDGRSTATDGVCGYEKTARESYAPNDVKVVVKNHLEVYIYTHTRARARTHTNTHFFVHRPIYHSDPLFQLCFSFGEMKFRLLFSTRAMIAMSPRYG